MMKNPVTNFSALLIEKSLWFNVVTPSWTELLLVDFHGIFDWHSFDIWTLHSKGQYTKIQDAWNKHTQLNQWPKETVTKSRRLRNWTRWLSFLLFCALRVLDDGFIFFLMSFLSCQLCFLMMLSVRASYFAKSFCPVSSFVKKSSPVTWSTYIFTFFTRDSYLGNLSGDSIPHFSIPKAYKRKGRFYSNNARYGREFARSRETKFSNSNFITDRKQNNIATTERHSS